MGTRVERPETEAGPSAIQNVGFGGRSSVKTREEATISVKTLGQTVRIGPIATLFGQRERGRDDVRSKGEKYSAKLRRFSVNAREEETTFG